MFEHAITELQIKVDILTNNAAVAVTEGKHEEAAARLTKANDCLRAIKVLECIDDLEHQPAEPLLPPIPAPITPIPTPIPVTPPVVVTPVTPSVPPVASPVGVRTEEFHPHRGNNPQPQIWSMGKDEVIAFKIPADSFKNDNFTFEKLSAPVAMSISNVPGDFGDHLGGQQKGRYSTLGRQNMTQNSIRSVENGSDAHASCRMPTPTADGYLYVNVRWSVWDDYPSRNGKLVNFLPTPSGQLSLRRDG